MEGKNEGSIMACTGRYNCEIVNKLKKEIVHWKANHNDLVIKNQILMSRKDLPVDRIEIIRYLEKKGILNLPIENK